MNRLASATLGRRSVSAVNLMAVSSCGRVVRHAAVGACSSLSSADLLLQQHVQSRDKCRYFSSQPAAAKQQKAKAPPPRDTRLAGRRRFYKVVGIEPSVAPWKQQQNSGDETTVADPHVESPISAGVDGTQSATGVTTEMASVESMRNILDPSPSDSSSQQSEWYSVTLDKRTIRTPLGHALTVPSSTLALAIATEWDSQHETIRPAQMPLTTMVCTALDQIAARPQFYRDNILRYLKNDTTCYLTDPAEDRVLYRKQMKAWDDLRQWAQDHLGQGQHAPARAVGNDEGLIMSRARKSKPGAGLPHHDVLLEEAEAWVNSLDAWRLIAMQAVTVEAKSFLVGMAVVRGCEADHIHDEAVQSPPYSEVAKEAVEASRVEEEFNIEQWGLVEGGHDYDRLNCSISIHAATFVVSSIATPPS